MPSARHTFASVALVALAAAGASGCATTQQTSARLAVKSDRILARSKPVDLGKPSSDVKVLGTSLVGAGKDQTVVATLRNTSDHPVNDVPVGVGVATNGAKPTFVNLGKGTPYFQSHLPAVAPGATFTFVYEARKPLPAGTPTVQVGTPTHPPTTASSLPQLEMSSKLSSKQTATVELKNPTSIPQYDVEVYAAASRDGKVVAAGAAPLAFLNGGATASVHVPLVGDTKGARIQVFAPPTIFS